MGSILSDISSQNAFTAVVVAAVVVSGYFSLSSKPPTSQSAVDPGVTPRGKGKKKKQGAKGSEFSDEFGTPLRGISSKKSDAVVTSPAVIPGGFDETGSASEQPTNTSASAKSKKGRKKKTKAFKESLPGKDESSQSDHPDNASGTSAHINRSPSNQKRTSPPVVEPPPLPKSSPFDTDSPWKRVESHSRPAKRSSRPLTLSTELSSSDAGVTTSTTGNSSPVSDRTDISVSAIVDASGSTGDNGRTLAEKLRSKPMETHVTDMLEEPDHPALARVIRVQPRPGQQPAAGFSWADYEDVDVGSGALRDATDEDEGGWGVVRSKNRPKSSREATPTTSSTQKPPENLTKRQRQNANKREAEKAVKVEAEAQRQATLAKHKHELERERILEHYSRKGGAKTPGGGMQATVDERGKLVWE